MNRKYAWKADQPDFRDLVFKDANLFPKIEAKSEVDLRSNCSPVFDQGNIGSCTGNAIAGALEFLELKELADRYDGPEVFDPSKFVNISRLFVYWNERVSEGDPKEDGGAEIRDGIKSLVSIGACVESEWAYSEHNLFKTPSAKAFHDAKAHRISAYARLVDLDDMKSCLSAGYPFVFGFTVYEGFESDQVAATGMLELPKKGEQPEGGHAVMCVGFKEINGKLYFIVRNSWGSTWGDQGYFYMPVEYITNTNLADDMWIIVK